MELGRWRNPSKCERRRREGERQRLGAARWPRARDGAPRRGRRDSESGSGDSGLAQTQNSGPVRKQNFEAVLGQVGGRTGDAGIRAFLQPRSRIHPLQSSPPEDFHLRPNNFRQIPPQIPQEEFGVGHVAERPLPPSPLRPGDVPVPMPAGHAFAASLAGPAERETCEGEATLPLHHLKATRATEPILGLVSLRLLCPTQSSPRRRRETSPRLGRATATCGGDDRFTGTTSTAAHTSSHSSHRSNSSPHSTSRGGKG